MGVSVSIHAEDHHLAFSDLDPVLGDIEDPVEVHWTGSKEDIRLLEKWRHRDLILFVEDREHQERAFLATGTPMALPEDELRNAKKALASPLGDAWRSQVGEVGVARGVLLISSVVGSSLRSGKSPLPSISVVQDCLFRHVHPADANVLLRLRARS